jgi:hypothetical protein
MNIRRGPGHEILAAAIALCLLQNCATIGRGTRQKIPVTSAPAGAKVLVDGRDAGITPVTIRLKKKSPAVIRIEKDGYNPFEVRVTREKADEGAAVIGNIVLVLTVGGTVVLSPLVRDEAHDRRVSVLISLALAAAAFIGLDFATGAPYSLSPEYFNVELTPIGEKPRLDVVEVSEARLRAVSWIRIRAATSTPSAP